MALVALATAALALMAPGVAADALYGLLYGGFVLASLIRLAAAGLARAPPTATSPPDERLPRYTVIAPMFHEAEIAPSLVAALAALDYPPGRLEVLFVLETGDHATLRALRRCRPPGFMRIIVAPPGWPRTKPRACNVALAQATGDLVVIYDAEDRPDPGQLREAAARFATGSARLACLQAPLRIEPGPTFLERQFALEYALLFDTVLPAFARLGLPFPLGGTSNHFVTRILRSVGGWDPYNVTEDADLGFRLCAEGYEIGVLDRPTFETAPDRWRDWLAQRSRWVKGYIQTLAVHTRRAAGHRPETLVLVFLTLGLSVGSALAHAPMMLVLTGWLAWSLIGDAPPPLRPADLALLLTGWASFAIALTRALRRTDAPIDASRLADMAAAPLYWPLQTLAAARALAQFVAAPHRWDKTPHRPRTGQERV